MTQPLLQAADLRGAARLTADAVVGLANLVEAMHARILATPGLPALAPSAAAPDRTRGLTGLVYGAVRGATQAVAGTTDLVLSQLVRLLAEPGPHQAARPEREAVLAALNGVLGDHLAATDNPLAIPMAFRQNGKTLPLERYELRDRLSQASPKPLVVLHGLCMNDLQWRSNGHDHAQSLARELGYTPVYLHYNSGLSISTNGRILAQMMERLYDAWPQPVQRLVLLGHSMGGLVARSAIHHGAQLQRGHLRWPGRVSDLVCLGSPHLGAPLEQAAQVLDLLLGAAPYAAPLARVGKLRSAGINDLRMGNILSTAADGDGTQRSAQVPLPAGTRCHAVAGSLGTPNGGAMARLAGDGLVPVDSALGRSGQADRRLNFQAEHQAVLAHTGHLDLLSSAEVDGLLRRWLA